MRLFSEGPIDTGRLRAFSQYVYEQYYDPEIGWSRDYGRCTFVNHVFFLFPEFQDAVMMGFGDGVTCGLHDRGLCAGHDFVVRADGVVGDLWAFDYLSLPPIGRLGRGMYPQAGELVEMPFNKDWFSQVREDWTAFVTEDLF